MGDVGCLERGGRYIFAMVTKEMHYDKPSVAAIRLCLRSLQLRMRQLGICTIGAPRLACGLDNQEWTTIKSLLEETFNDSGALIYVYSLPG